MNDIEMDVTLLPSLNGSFEREAASKSNAHRVIDL